MGSSWAQILRTGMATSSTSLKGSLCSQYTSHTVLVLLVLPPVGVEDDTEDAGSTLGLDWQKRTSSRTRREQLENRVSVCMVSPSIVRYLGM